MMLQTRWLLPIAFILVTTGKSPGADSPADGKKLYLTYCSSCHGETGKGDGPAAKSLPVKPADHTNGAEMNQFSDKSLQEIISKGGSAVGKSPIMPAWGNLLSQKQLSDLVAYIRSIAQSPYKAAGG